MPVPQKTLPQFPQYEIDNLNSHLAIKEIKFKIKILPKMRPLGSDGHTR